MISEGQRNDINYAIPLLDHVNTNGSNVLADRGYDCNKLIDYIYAMEENQRFLLEKVLNLNAIAIGGFTKRDIWQKIIFSN